jgi:hypothetical protein
MGGWGVTYSPSPWRVSHDENDAMTFNGAKPTAVLDANGLPVACNNTYYPTSLDPDNAALIAAAPELLEACRQLVIAQSGYPMTGIQAEQYLQNAIAAIDKALGQ